MMPHATDSRLREDRQGRYAALDEIFERKRAFYLVMLQDVRKNEALIQECHDKSLFFEEHRLKIKKHAEVTKSLQEQAMHAMQEELCALMKMMKKDKSEENRSPEHAPEKNGTTTYERERELSSVVIPKLPLNRLSAPNHMPGEQPYIVGPSQGAGENESDDESHGGSSGRKVISPTSPPIPKCAMMNMSLRPPPRLNLGRNCVMPVNLSKSLSTKDVKLKIAPLSLGRYHAPLMPFNNQVRPRISLWKNAKVAPPTTTFVPTGSLTNLNARVVVPFATTNGKSSPEFPDFRLHNSTSQIFPLINEQRKT